MKTVNWHHSVLYILPGFLYMRKVVECELKDFILIKKKNSVLNTWNQHNIVYEIYFNKNSLVKNVKKINK